MTKVAGGRPVCRLGYSSINPVEVRCKRVVLADNKQGKELFNGARNRVISHSRVGGLPGP